MVLLNGKKIGFILMRKISAFFLKKLFNSRTGNINTVSLLVYGTGNKENSLNID